MEMENPHSNGQNQKDGPEDLSSLNQRKEQEFTSLCTSMDDYDWANDNVYQRALERMSQTTQLEPLELELQARCFYWARKFKVEVDYLKYRDWKMAHSSEPPNHQVAHTSTPPTYSQSFSIDDLGANQPVATENNTSEILPSYTEPLSEDTLSPPAPYPPSFDEVVEMIQSGRGHLLPGIKTIPPTVLTDKITTSTVDLRKKPWEKDDVPPQAGGMFGDKRDIFINQEEE